MELGPAIGVFVTVAILLMGLFCVVTRYFNYKLRKALQQQAEIYSLIQGIQGEREDINEGQYQDFVNKRILDKKQREIEKDKNYQMMIEMTDDVNQPLKDASANIYGVPKINKRLNKDLVFEPESARSMVSSKSFKPDKLSHRSPNFLSPKSTFSKRTDAMNSESSKKRAEVTHHKTVSKLVCYTEQGISILQIKTYQLCRQNQGQQIKQKKTLQKTNITPVQLGFEEALQAYGFQKGIFEACRYITTYQIVGMKPNEVYRTRSLKKTQQKQPMQFPSYYISKDRFEQQLNNSQQKLKA